MATRRPHDPGLGVSKKYDDPTAAPAAYSDRMLRCLGTFRRRRILLALLTVWLLYVFFKNMPTDLVPVNQRLDSRYGRLGGAPTPGLASDSRTSPHGSQDEQYDGPVRFFNLASSLRPFLVDSPSQSNVLFAFASLSSASAVVTAACTMAAQNRSVVHVAATGIHEITLDQVLKVNRIQVTDCPVHWHDAQVDFAAESSAARLTKGAEGSFGHIHRALSLQAVFFDDGHHEEDYLQAGVTKAAKRSGVAAIRLPDADSWVLALSGSSLRWWNRLQVDIVIRAQPESAGSLLRLMRSLRAADYGGLPLPRIVLDLPPRTDPHIFENLQGFIWPPGSPPAESKLAIRRRVEDKALSPAAASIQVVESFYPMAPESSHVLVLSPAVEVARNYYQLLIYLILEYRYGASADVVGDNLMGIELLNSQHLTSDQEPVVLSQALHADAALFFGDKWAEMHEYLSIRLVTDPQLSKSVDPADGPLAADAGPTWARLAEEMMRALGYAMLVPQVSNTDSPLAVLHSELYQVPEERRNQEAPSAETIDLGMEKDVLTAQKSKSASAAEGQPLSRASLLSLLDHGSSPARLELDKVPLYSHKGEVVDMKTFREDSARYAKQLSVDVGGCAASQGGQPGSLESLFC